MVAQGMVSDGGVLGSGGGRSLLCSALTWLFKSQSLLSKQNRPALQQYDMGLQWPPGARY